MSAEADDVDLLPARMVNEFIYCPRLFYLEWVDGRFEDNDDTVIGRHAHRAVDEERGPAPLPTDGALLEARSVMLSSAELGVIAKMDLIEGRDGAVVPVDFKKGRPQPDGSPWPSDSVQVCLQAMVLRDHGYRCEHGEVYYAQIRQRVRIELTDASFAGARENVQAGRAVAAPSVPADAARRQPQMRPLLSCRAVPARRNQRPA